LTTIRVNPTELRRAAVEIEQAADRFRLLADDVLRATQAAPNYDGDFGPQVRSIGMEGYARLKTEADRLGELSQTLARKAEAFEAVDAQGAGAMGAVGQTLCSWQESGLQMLSDAGLSWADVRRDLGGEGDKGPPPALAWLLGFVGFILRPSGSSWPGGGPEAATTTSETPLPPGQTPTATPSPTMVVLPTAPPTPEGTPTAEEIWAQKRAPAERRRERMEAEQQAVEVELFRQFAEGRRTAEDILRPEIDKASDPFRGTLPLEIEYSGSFYEKLDQELGRIYDLAGLDLTELAAERRGNELTEEILLEYEGDTVYADEKGDEVGLLPWLQGRLAMGASHPEYVIFLREVGIDHWNRMNFEPNYLRALMDAHPEFLDRAKDKYLTDLLGLYGNDPKEALAWMQWKKETGGTE